jgi:uncharacterized membrane protein
MLVPVLIAVVAIVVILIVVMVFRPRSHDTIQDRLMEYSGRAEAVSL